MLTMPYMKFIWKIYIILIISTTSSCDTTYKFRSKNLYVNSSLDFKEYMRIEGVNSVFPELTKINFVPTKKTQSSLLLAIIYNRFEDVLKTKSLIKDEKIKSVSRLKSILVQKKSTAIIMGPYKMNEFKTIDLKDVGVLREGLWLVFASDEQIDSLSIQLEFNRTGINEFPNISIKEIKAERSLSDE